MEESYDMADLDYIFSKQESMEYYITLCGLTRPDIISRNTLRSLPSIDHTLYNGWYLGDLLTQKGIGGVCM